MVLDRGPVDLNLANRRIYLKGEVGNGVAVDINTSIDDQLLHIAATAEPRASQDTIEALLAANYCARPQRGFCFSSFFNHFKLSLFGRMSWRQFAIAFIEPDRSVA